MAVTDGIRLQTRSRGKYDMQLNIYDTLQKSKVKFIPVDLNNVRIYVCGPTVYDYPHIGNARPVVIFDTLVRLLRTIYKKVTYVRNITDIDDKINARSLESGEDISLITSRTEKIFSDDMLALNALPPDVEPRATEHIAEMINFIKLLITKGHAYEVERHVLFKVDSMRNYGKLSGLSNRQIISGARVDIAPIKQDPRDFVLWKPSSEEIPGWQSPWGRGRPGWHIECSAMSQKHLGDTFDIHGGGQDLIFPHHENEIAQSKCALGPNAFAKYWMHNGYLMSESEKMSKSRNNFYTVRELLKEFPGEAIRFLLLKTHYRQPLDFTKQGLIDAKQELDRFYRAILDITIKDKENLDSTNPNTALFDDLNTPLAISHLHELTSKLNKATSEIEKQTLAKKLINAGSLLGLIQTNPQDWFKWQPKTEIGIGFNDQLIEKMISERHLARLAKNFEEGDKIRNTLLENGIMLEDKDGHTIWRRT